MKFQTKIAAVAATVLSSAGLLLAGGAPASAAAADTVTITFCNDGGSQFSYDAMFPQRGMSTFVVSPGQCVPGWDFVSPGEPYITRVYAGDGRYRDTAGYTVWACNERVTLFGTYDATNMQQQCV